MEHEQGSKGIDEFEEELLQAMRRVDAPASLKQGLLERRRFQRPRSRREMWERLAATLLMAAVVGGGLYWRHEAEEQRKGEEARRQVLQALRITNHALQEMNTRLAEHNRYAQE